MKFRKTAALVTSLLLAGSASFTPFFNSPASTYTISAALETSNSLSAFIENANIKISPGGKITIGTLQEHGLHVYRTFSRFEITEEITDMSVLAFDMPEITESGTYEVTISHRLYDDYEPVIIFLSVMIDNSVSKAPVYSIRTNSGKDEYSYIYENGEQKKWNSTYKVECNTRPENYMVPAYCGNLKDPDENERKNRIFSLSENSVDVSGATNIYVPQGIYEIKQNAFTNTYSVKTITIADSVKLIEDQNLNWNITVRGNIGSSAEMFADKNGLNFEYIGDINNDGNIDASDILKMYTFMEGISEPDKNEAGRADKNMDTKISIADLVLLKNAVLEPGISVLGAPTSGAVAVPDLVNFKKIDKPENIDGYMNFAAETAGPVLLDTEDKAGPENTVYSPLSVYMALSMAAECSDGNTLNEFLNVLHADGLNDLRYENSNLFRSLYFDDYMSYLKIANSIWLNKSFSFNRSVLDSIAKNYYGISFVKDYHNPNTPEEIADWISLNTSGKFRPVYRIDQPDREMMRIINTVTFKERWENEFGKASPDTFHLKNGEDIQCDFLKRTTKRETENIGFADTFMKYGLSMNDGYKMNFILPDEGVSIDSIVADKEIMDQIFSDDLEYQKRKIVFSVPKFDVASKFKLVETSQKLGLIDAFDPIEGDFSKVLNYNGDVKPDTYISDIIHEAVVKIDEEGCEASAYTIIQMMFSTGIDPDYEPVIFKLNRPFFYYISDKNDVPVFSGIINDPTKK